MARSIVYNGTDFSPWTTAEAVLPAAHGVSCEVAEVPGRAGAVLLSASVSPKDVRVRLFLDLEDDCDEEGLSAVRHGLAASLACTEGAELELPGEPGLVYKDAFCTGASEWSRLFEDGSCELSFTALDPIAWGQSYTVSPAFAGDAFTFYVGGTWRSAPTVSMAAAAGDAVAVELAGAGERVEVGGPFVGGEAVVVDCGSGRVTVDGEAADAAVALGSDFFFLEPGMRTLSFEGCASCSVGYSERWL